MRRIKHFTWMPAFAGMTKVMISVIIAFLALPMLAFALPTDNQQKVYIISDTSVYNYKSGVNVFEGHVIVNQGTTHITADKLVTKSNASHKMREATAYGFQDLAHYWTTPKLNEAEIHAHAKIIRFFPIVSNVTLEQDVTVKQGENSFQGQLIHYNSSNQTITVPAASNSRAVLVYNPNK